MESRLENTLDPSCSLRFYQAHDFIAQNDPEAAHKIAQRILDAIGKLLEFPRIGRIGEDEDTREWIVPKTPYMLVYTIKEDAIELLRVWHMSQDR